MRAFAAVIALLSVAVRVSASCTPDITAPAILAYAGYEAWIDGKAFGTGAGRSLVITNGTTTYTYDSTQVVAWTDTQIKVTLPAGVDSTYTAQVIAGDKASAIVPFRVYAKTLWPAPQGTIALNRDEDGAVYVAAENNFVTTGCQGGGSVCSAMTSFTAAGVRTDRAVPVTAIFRDNPVFQNPSQQSAGQEEVLIDGDDVYQPLAGWLAYRQMSGTSSQGGVVVRRTGESFKCYYVPTSAKPGYSPEPTGIIRNGFYITVVASGMDAFLSIDPDNVSASFTDCTTGTVIPLCPSSGGTDCWIVNQVPRRYPKYKDPSNGAFYIGDVFPAHVAQSADGALWTSGLMSGDLWRLSAVGPTGVWTSWKIPDRQRNPNLPWPDRGPGTWHLYVVGDVLYIDNTASCAVDTFNVTTFTFGTHYQAECGSATANRMLYWSQLDSGGRLWVSGQLGPPGVIRQLGYFDTALPAGRNYTAFPPTSLFGIAGCAEPEDTVHGLFGFEASDDGRLIDLAMYGANCGYVLHLVQVP